MKTLKSSLIILCLLLDRAVGLPQFGGASFQMKKIIINSPTYGTHEVLVDDRDYKKVSKHKWFIRRSRGTSIYASSQKWANNKPTSFTLHALILKPPKGMVIDHKNGNGLDNRRSNLRICTNAENCRNSVIPKSNTTGFKGVSIDKRDRRIKKFRAFIKLNKVQISLGYHHTAVEAAQAYNCAALKYHGEFARLNIIP